MLVLGVLSIGGAALPVPAAQAAEPQCLPSQETARAGHERVHQVYCPAFRPRVAATELVRAPDAGTLTGLRPDGSGLTWTFTPADDEDQSFDVRVTLVDDTTATVTIPIDVVPLAENRAPECHASPVAQRTTGDGPVVLEYAPRCWDADGDPVIVHGGGPGTHLDSPSGPDGVWQWRYRTAASTGTETTSVWAIDVLGARSATRAVPIEIGPLVDAPVRCAPTDFGASAADTIQTRPGRVRDFGVLCIDPDPQDAITATPGTTPHGTLAIRDARAASGWWGSQLHLDVRYTPSDGGLRDDPADLAIVSGARSSVYTMRIATVDPTTRGSLSCSQYDEPLAAGLWGQRLECTHSLGDPVTAEIVRGPARGTATGPTVGAPVFGAQPVEVAYTPAPGFLGRDTVGLRVGPDALDDEIELGFTLDRWPVPRLPFPLPPGAPGTTPPVPTAPGATRIPSRTAAQQARTALGTKDVRAVRSIGTARVWAPRGPAVPGRAGLAITCVTACQVSSRARTLTSGPRAAAARTIRGLAAAGRPLVLRVPAGGRKARRAEFRLTVTEGRTTRRTTVRLALRR